ncbi:hypothetical protein [Rubritalea tangerina]|uniref:hypothetical protein n=1 Tax=Rubritalea tangerina TaxID=430798 RepID=UPI003608CF23
MFHLVWGANHDTEKVVCIQGHDFVKIIAIREPEVGSRKKTANVKYQGQWRESAMDKRKKHGFSRCVLRGSGKCLGGGSSSLLF